MLRAPHEPPIKRQIQGGHDGADDGRRDCVASGVETPRQIVLSTPSKHSNREKREGDGSGLHVWRTQPRVRENEMHERQTLSDGQGGNRNEQEDDTLENGIENAIQLVELFLRIELREDG